MFAGQQSRPFTQITNTFNTSNESRFEFQKPQMKEQTHSNMLLEREAFAVKLRKQKKNDILALKRQNLFKKVIVR